MKNNYFLYNLKGIARSFTPAIFLPKNREKILKDVLARPDIEYIKSRVDYNVRLIALSHSMMKRKILALCDLHARKACIFLIPMNTQDIFHKILRHILNLVM